MMDNGQNVEMELVGREIVLIRVALRLRAHHLPNDSEVKRIYARMAAELKPIGLYQFPLPDVARICMALGEYAQFSGEIGILTVKNEMQLLLNQYLTEWFKVCPIEEVRRMTAECYPLQPAVGV